MKSCSYLFLAALAVVAAPALVSAEEEKPIFLGDFADSLRQASNETTTTEAPTVVPGTEAPFVATFSPTFREGDIPTVFEEPSSEIVNPVFVAPVAPPPISRAAPQQQWKLPVVLFVTVAAAAAAAAAGL